MSRPGTLDKEIGARLRAVRERSDLSLNDVQAKSGGQFKAAVTGAYERGERALAVHRLYALAEFYGVSAHDLLPPREVPDDLRGHLVEAEERAWQLWQEIASTRAWFPTTPPHPDGKPS